MRLFIAIDLPSEIKSRISAASSNLPKDGAVFVVKELYHITLQFLGSVRKEDLTVLDGALKRVSHERFSAGISGLSYFSPASLRVVYAAISSGSAEIISLHDEICLNLSASGITYEKEHSYVPHATVARVNRAKNPERTIESINGQSNVRFGSFEVLRFVLKESEYINGQLNYRNLREYGLK